MSIAIYRATSAGLSGTFLRVDRLHVVEGLDTVYEATATVLIDEDGADPAAMLGKDFTVEMQRSTAVRKWTGVVREVRQSTGFDTTVGERATFAEVSFVPALWFLSLKRNTRIFQEKTALDIVKSVLEEGLGAFSREIEVAAAETYPTREYCVQYQETDLAFVRRLLEEEGIAFSFNFDGEKEVLRLTDANAQFSKIANIAGDGRVQFHGDNRTLDDSDPLHAFSRRRNSITTSVVVRDHDFTAPAKPENEQRSQDEQGRDRESYEHGLGRSLTIGDYSGGRFGAEDSSHQAQVRHQANLSRLNVLFGEGRSTGLVAGQTFEIFEHPIVGIDGEYLLTRVEHFGGAAAPRSGRLDDDSAYLARIECIPVATVHRPLRRTPKPSISGHETAIVTGPSGEEIHTDQHGRIKVQFHWDRQGANDDKTTCFIRVRQAWAGAGWGYVFIPRIGMEVVVSFLDGDPDRPIVTGSVYNATNRPPYPLPDEKTKSTIKSQSSTGNTSGFNELRFEDKAGSEEVFSHAQKDQNEVVENNHTTTVTADQENIVGATQTQKIHKNQTEKISGDQTMKVGTDRTVHVLGTFTEKVDKGEKRNVDTGVTEVLTGFEYRKVSGGLTDKITGGEGRLVVSGIDEDITGTHKQHVDGSNTEVMLSGSKQSVTAGPVTYTTAGVYKLKSGGPVALNGLAGITIHTLHVEKKTKVESEFHPIYCKPKTNDKSEADAQVDLYGTKTDLIGMPVGGTSYKISAFGASLSHNGIKWANQLVKIDLYASKSKIRFADVSIMTFQLDL